MIAGILGALLLGGEYSTGIIRVTFAARPQRTTVLTAKAALVAAATIERANLPGRGPALRPLPNTKVCLRSNYQTVLSSAMTGAVK
jgi:hypothetical protein